MNKLNRKRVTTMLENIFAEESLHAKRMEAIANYAIGTMEAPRAAIHAIGAAYAKVAHIQSRHGVKQADRFLSNPGIDIAALTPAWAKFVIGPRTEIIVARRRRRFVHIPMPLAVSRRNHVDPLGDLWMSVLEATGQPVRFE